MEEEKNYTRRLSDEFLMSVLITEKHVCHLSELTDEQLNKLLNNIVDMENLYISISRQEDLDIKKVSC